MQNDLSLVRVAGRLWLVVDAVRREITFKTDPEKGDYELETGASRNFESWTDKQATEDAHKKARYARTYQFAFFDIILQ